MKSKFYLALSLIAVIACGILAKSQGLRVFPIRFVLEDLRVVSQSADVEDRLRLSLKGLMGEDMFELDLNELRSRIMENPRVEAVEIHRRWPDTLMIQVVEREAVAVAFKASKLYLLDRNGMWIENLRIAKGLPLIMGASNEKMPLAEICQWLFAVQSEGNPEYLSYSKIDEISWDKDRGVILRSVSLGLTILLGFENFEVKWHQAQRAFYYSYQRGRLARTIDADNPKRVILAGESVTPGVDPQKAANF